MTAETGHAHTGAYGAEESSTGATTHAYKTLINGSSGSVDVSLDGVTVAGLSLTGQNLGSNPITALQLGDNTGGRTYDIDFDDISVTQSS